MTQDATALYSALASRDPRFDGVFFVGVTSTGIYCRPVCPARTPKAKNCRFFFSAAAAEHASFRPCLRCRPELAPGNAPVDDAQRIASLIVSRVEEGIAEEDTGLEQIAAQFGLSSRQIRRIIQKELGVSPIELVLTRRLLLAKQLLTETTLPITQVAYASGFASPRRFNDAFRRSYGMPPSRLRKAVDGASDAPSSSDETLTLQLAYRPPYDWPGVLAFMHKRVLRGVELIADDEYWRTARIGGATGWIHVRHAPEKRALLVEVTHSLVPVLPAVLSRMRHVFDLSARPDVIAAQLAQDPRLAEIAARHPGLRVPGAFDGFELAVRAILGQQITVKAAATMAGRFVAAFGEPITTPHAGLDRLCPTAARVAALSVDDIASLGIVQTRARSIITLAGEVAAGRLKLVAGAHPEATMAQLVALPGIGKWTAHYIALRALRWPDAFPKEDIVLQKRLGGVSARVADEMSQAWRPWRSYATLHLWRAAPQVGAEGSTKSVAVARRVARNGAGR
ncbi:MAG: AlkA N-terminal domain-containing protein [Longimicrobiales bacterium]